MKTRRPLWHAAGLVLAATATTAPGQVVTAPAPGIVPATAECCPTPRGYWFSPTHRGKPAKPSHFLGEPGEFVPVPLGQNVNSHFDAMIANGVAARMVLHHFDFLHSTDVLNMRGTDHLFEIAHLARHNACPIVIERTPENPGLAEARRLAVQSIVAQHGIGAERVIVGRSTALGMTGVEAQSQFQLQINNLNQQGIPKQPPINGFNTGSTGQGAGQR